MTPRSRAIRFDPDLLDELERWLGETGEDLDRFVNAAVQGELRRRDGRPALVAPPDLGAVAGEYTTALLERDARRARLVVEDALAAGAPVIDIYRLVLQPAMEEIGHRWVLDKINVAQEHFATAVTQQVLASLGPDGSVPALGGRLAIVSASPDELHWLGAQMVADVLQRDGWEVLHLGAATPAHDLLELVSAECPDVVALSTSTAGRFPLLQQLLQDLAGAEPRPFIALGGPLFTPAGRELALGLGADLVTSELWELLEVLRRRFPPA